MTHAGSGDLVSKSKVVTFGDRERIRKAADAAVWKYVWYPREKRERERSRS